MIRRASSVVELNVTKGACEMTRRAPSVINVD